MSEFEEILELIQANIDTGSVDSFVAAVKALTELQQWYYEAYPQLREACVEVVHRNARQTRNQEALKAMSSLGQLLLDALVAPESEACSTDGDLWDTLTVDLEMLEAAIEEASKTSSSLTNGPQSVPASW